MRGITPILSIMVLVILTISIVSLAYWFVFGYFTGMTRKLIQVTDVFCNSEGEAKILVRNIGSDLIDSGEFLVQEMQSGTDISDQVVWVQGYEASSQSPVLHLKFDEPDGGAVIDSSGLGNNGMINGSTVLLMHMDEGSGTDTYDLTINRNDGDLASGPEWVSSDCVSGNCLKVNGSLNQNILLNPFQGLDFGTGDFTLSTWFRSGDIGPISNAALLTTHFSVFFPGYHMYFDSSKNLVLRLRDSTGNINNVTFDANPYLDNTWHHFLAMRNQTGIYLFIDGSMVNSSANHLVIARPTFPAIYLGWNIEGVLDEYALYNRALTEAEISELYSGGRAKFFERAPGRVGNAIKLDGIHEFIEVPSSESLKISQFPITIAAWVYSPSLGSATRTFIQKGVYGSDNRFRNYYIGVNGGRLYVQQANGTHYTYCSDNSRLLSDGTWQHVAVVLRDFVSNAELFVDGERWVTNCNFPPAYPPSEPIYTDDMPLVVGVRDPFGGGGAGGYFFEGMIDDVRVYDVALTADEIGALSFSSTDIPPNMLATMTHDCGIRNSCNYKVSLGTQSVSRWINC